MKPLKPLSIVMVLTAALLTLTGTNAHTRWTLNYSDIAFDGSGETAVLLQEDIAAGAGYFLEAYAQTLLLMKKLEVPGAESMKDAPTGQPGPGKFAASPGRLPPDKTNHGSPAL
jgi:hypothetical protein